MQYRSVTVLAPAKLNLTLDITGVQENGYHTMDMLMLNSPRDTLAIALVMTGLFLCIWGFLQRKEDA